MVGGLLLVLCAYQLLTEDGQLLEIVNVRASSFKLPFSGPWGTGAVAPEGFTPGTELSRCVKSPIMAVNNNRPVPDCESAVCDKGDGVQL